MQKSLFSETLSLFTGLKSYFWSSSFDYLPLKTYSINSFRLPALLFLDNGASLRLFLFADEKPEVPIYVLSSASEPKSSLILSGLDRVSSRKNSCSYCCLNRLTKSGLGISLKLRQKSVPSWTHSIRNSSKVLFWVRFQKFFMLSTDLSGRTPC